MKKFELFLDIAQTENFTYSGKRLGYTQSGVSRAMKSLEIEVGFPLFIRHKQNVTLTERAKRILPEVKAILQANERLEQQILLMKNVEEKI